MSFETIFLLAVIQGLTEFLPISSSAHLILPSQLLGWPDQGLAFDVAVHGGTLIAVCWYLRAEILRLGHAWLRSFKHGSVRDADARISWFILFATLPALVAGFMLNDIVELSLRSIEVIGTTTIVFGLLLWYADSKGVQQKSNDQMSWSLAMLIGAAQALAIIPGTSRSGVTMTASLLLGFDRQSAARFSFLLAIPLIGAAASYKTLELVQAAQPPIWSEIVTGLILSAISAYFCIHFFFKLIDRVGMRPFVFYRLVLGTVLVFLALASEKSGEGRMFDWFDFIVITILLLVVGVIMFAIGKTLQGMKESVVYDGEERQVAKRIRVREVTCPRCERHGSALLRTETRYRCESCNYEFNGTRQLPAS